MSCLQELQILRPLCEAGWNVRSLQALRSVDPTGTIQSRCPLPCPTTHNAGAGIGRVRPGGFLQVVASPEFTCPSRDRRTLCVIRKRCRELSRVRPLPLPLPVFGKGLGGICRWHWLKSLRYARQYGTLFLDDFRCFSVPPMLLESIGYDHGSNCHGRGRGFEPRRPRHSFQKTYGTYGDPLVGAERCNPSRES